MNYDLLSKALRKNLCIESVKLKQLKRVIFISKMFLFFGTLFFSSVVSAQIQKGTDIDGEAAGDESGYSVSMPDANTVAIGAKGNSENGVSVGHVRIYTWDGSVWVQKGKDVDGEAVGDNSGYSVSMPDANTVAIGAHLNDDNGNNAGHVRIYTWNGSAWVQKGDDIDGEEPLDWSGYSVSMPDANAVAIGAILNDGNGDRSGHVRIYTWDGTAWVQKGTDIDGEAVGDFSGNSVSMPDANTVAIGAYLNDGNAVDVGHVRIYTWDGTAWIQRGTDIDGEALGDNSGYSVSMSDANTVAIGANLNDGNGDRSGHVRIYTWDGTVWVQKGTDIDGEALGDNSGYSVSMPDANTVAIGANWNDGNGDRAGHVRIYNWNSSVWMQKGIDIDGEAAVDYSGNSVSMPDANTVAIGAYLNDDNGNNAGHVRVYTVSCCLDLTHQANDPFNSGPSLDPFIMDVDNDGDKDWLRVNLATGEINYLENTNNTGYPNFDVGSGLKSIDFDNSFFSSSYYGYDYNQDGFTDIFALSGSELLYCENGGIIGSPEYTVYNTGVNISSSPHFSIGDIGNDGLPDLIVGGYFRILYYQHVTGTNCNSPSQPCFELAGNSSSNPFIGSTMLEEEIPIPEIYDGDCDGDLDLYIGTVGEILWFKNDGTVTPQGSVPSFDLNPVSNPHGISNLVTTGEEFVIPRFIDIEADGDDELFIIEGNNKVQFYENCGDLVSTTRVETHRKVGIYPNPADDIFYIDLNSFRRQIASVKVYDITGLLVLTKYQDKIPLGSNKIIVDDLSRGIYIIQIEFGEGFKAYGKVIIQ